MVGGGTSSSKVEDSHFQEVDGKDLSISTPTVPVDTARLTPAAREVEELGNNWFYVAASHAMREVRRQVNQVANIDVPVLLLGESGTGKEVIARLIHRQSARSHRTFMKVNCAALPMELLESELFGYMPGAFTGATHPKPGKFEVCHKGTIFLDEVAEMPIPPQAKLLHVLQDGEFSRLGSPTSVKVDVRILAATNVDIQQAIEGRRFRADLYYRLDAFTIHLPPLRERKEEIPILLNHFITNWAHRYGRPRPSVSVKMLDACLAYSWPGNVRELENFVKYYLVVEDQDQALGKLGVGYNRPQWTPTCGIARIPASGESGNMKSMVRDLKHGAEKEAILKALEQSKGSRANAAKILQISLRSLHYKLRQYRISAPSQRRP